jgi:tetratricopeptide (TPR) repeat protein
LRAVLRARCVLVATLLCAAPAGAADEELSPETRTARAHYRAGQAYFRQGELRRALAEFKAAARDDARPELDYNIALTHDRLGDAARAIDGYRRFLAARPDAAERHELEARIVTLERSVGELVIHTRVRGAAVLLDGEIVDTLSYNRPLRVTEGAHELSASKAPLMTQRRTVRTVAGKRVEVEIDPREGDGGLDRRARLGIGLGVGAAVLVLTGVALGVYFGTRDPEAFDPGGAGGVVTVRPVALGVGR